MKNFIDPVIDCVFKKILGAAGNESILLDFLNRILNPEPKIIQVTVENPYNERDYLEDKLSIVDIEAKDETGKIYQIEVQVATPSYLPFRMLHNWSSIYKKQLTKGMSYIQLKPVISIWLLSDQIIKDSPACHHHFEVYDKVNGVQLADHMSIHVLELNKWEKPDRLQPEDYWLYFFKEGKKFKTLPTELKSQPQMREAMTVLEAFSDQDEDYYRYRVRQECIRIQKSDEELAELREQRIAEAEGKMADAHAKTADAEAKTADAEAKTAKALEEATQFRLEIEAEKEKSKQAETQIEQLKAMLRQTGAKPDSL